MAAHQDLVDFNKYIQSGQAKDTKEALFLWAKERGIDLGDGDKGLSEAAEKTAQWLLGDKFGAGLEEELAELERATAAEQSPTGWVKALMIIAAMMQTGGDPSLAYQMLRDWQDRARGIAKERRDIMDKYRQRAMEARGLGLQSALNERSLAARAASKGAEGPKGEDFSQMRAATRELTFSVPAPGSQAEKQMVYDISSQLLKTGAASTPEAAQQAAMQLIQERRAGE